MAASEAAICNLGLLNIGHTKFITALDDATTEAEVCNLIYAQTRDEMLGAFRWPFAKKRATPSPIGGDDYVAITTYATSEAATDLVDGFVYVSLVDGNQGNTPSTSPTFWRKVSRTNWTFLFLLPLDSIELHAVSAARRTREDLAVPYEIENDETLGTVVLTDEEEPEFLYTSRLENVALYPADFTRALAWALSVPLAGALKKDAQTVVQCMRAAAASLADAAAGAKRESRGDAEPVPHTLAARR